MVCVAVVVIEYLVDEVWLFVVCPDFVEVDGGDDEVRGGVVVSFAREYLSHVV